MSVIERDIGQEIGTGQQPLWQRAGKAVVGLALRYADWRRRRRTLYRLTEAEDWLLDDIGITRDELNAALQGYSIAVDRVEAETPR